MAAPTTILVTGSSGHLGRLIVSELLSFNTEGGEGVNVIAASRDVAELNELAKQGAETRRLDLDDYDLTRTALQGVDVVVLVSTGVFTQRIFQHRNAIRAAESVGVRHLIYTSFVNPKPGEGLFNDHFFTEVDLASSSLKWTILRNNSYSETLFLTLPIFLKSGIFPTAAGQGKRSYISRLDCAALAASVAANPSAYERRVIDVSGDEAFSAEEVADLASRVTDKPMVIKQLSIPDYVRTISDAHVPDWWCNVAPELEYATGNGSLSILNGGLFKQIVGRAPISLHMFLQNNKDQFLSEQVPIPEHTT
jgi:NAD(P)H dehydrogenase (quinone)